MTWTVCRADVACSAAYGCRIPAGEPVALLLGGKIRRCARHAEAQFGYRVDWAEIERERFRLEADLARESRASLRWDDENARLKAAKLAQEAERRMVPLREVANGMFDPKMRAAGERQED